MTLFKLSFKNIKKSFKDYAIYFFTLILGVAIFYLFNSLDSQTVMLKMSNSTQELVDMMINMLSGVSVLVSIILGFLVIYASRFLMKRRNKEFGLYMMLGMSKGKISKILLFETLLIGLISLLVGLGIGIAGSQLMSIFVADMFEVNMTDFTFVFSSAATIKTVIYFGIIYFIVMIFNTISVNRCKLIDLLQSSKKSEKVKMKNPYLCTIIFIIAVCVLGYAYYLVTGGVKDLEAEDIYQPIVLGIISTFLIFWSLSGLILKLVMSLKKVYYKGLNSFTIRQISSKINTTVFSMSIICLMLFMTICVLSSGLSLKNSMTANLQELAPADFEIQKAIANPEQEYSQEQVNFSKMPILEQVEAAGINKNALTNIVDVPIYQIPELTTDMTLGKAFEKVKKEYPMIRFTVGESFMTLSDYNQLAKVYQQKTLSLKPNSYAIVADYGSMVEIRDLGLKAKAPITVQGKTYMPQYDKCQEGFVEISANHVNSGVFVVPDEALEGLIPERMIFSANYRTDNQQNKAAYNDKLKAYFNQARTNHEFIYFRFNTKPDIYEAAIGLGAIVTFIGLYLGIIFLITSAAILALKELSESTDNKDRYQMIRRLGADEKLLNRSLFRQIAIFFSFPLVLAIIHSIFGIMFCNYILETFGNEKLLVSLVMTAIFLIVIYGGYFLITYFCSKNIIRDKS